MTHYEAAHMFAAAVHAHPAGELGRIHQRLEGRLNTFPVEHRREALDLARSLSRMVEYYEARNGELPLLASIFDRGERGLPVDAHLAKLETYWQRMVSWLQSLGPHPSPLVIHGPAPERWPAYAEVSGG
jgi:hypothetical protein